MKIMIATRSAPLVLLRCVFASLPFACLPMTVVGAAESEAQTPATVSADATPVPRRSHIQPVGEIAMASRNPDTLGLRLTRATEVLRQQLSLARGAGLVVEDVIPGSVAEKAGFKQHDVLVLLDDQMLLLPEQLVALLEASTGTSIPECTLLRGGAKVTLQLGQPGRAEQPTLPTPSRPVAPTITAPTITATPTPPQPMARQQLAAKPATNSRLRAAASTLALVQPTQAEWSGQPTQAAVQALASTPAAGAGSSIVTAGRNTVIADETLIRHDPDFQIKLSRGNETRLVVLDPHGRILFNDEIDTPKHRSLVPAAVRQRVEDMERSLETATKRPVAEVGSLDVAPVEIR
jgi:hypothetical protein